ncbi:MAG: hypothetical protein LBO62_07305 [Endomicrobium sp.]|jgi:hypothetical protein|nr:hypothetical protein [Endomicrobium sp.]
MNLELDIVDVKDLKNVVVSVKKGRNLIWKKDAQAIDSTNKAINNEIALLTKEAEKVIKKAEKDNKSNEKLRMILTLS